MRTRAFDLVRCLPLAALLAWPGAAAAQQSFRISGTVVDATTQRPLPSVQVTLAGTQQGTLTGANGAFVLNAQVQPGTYDLRFTYIGRNDASQEVTLGNLADVDVGTVTLTESAVQLEGIIVTGSGVATQRRALGNAVSVVGGAAIEEANAVTVDQALQGKVAGAQIMSNTGTPGGGVSVRLRGTSSIVGGAEPLYIIDGVIIDNSSDQQINFGYRSNPSNRVADINPNDIERIEVLKGAAAAARYVSRANNGVIQIFTKRGAAGDTRFNISTRATLGQLPKEIGIALTPVDEAGQPVERFDHQDLVFKDAWGNETTLSISGGGDQTRFYMSGAYTKDNGIMIGSSNQRISGRINVDQTVGSWLSLSGGANYVRNSSDLLINGESGTGGILTAVAFTPTLIDLTEKDPVTGQYVFRQGTTPNPLEVIDFWKYPQTINRFIGSFQGRATPEGWPSLEYRLGYDTYNMETDQFIPRGTPLEPTGKATAVTRTQYLINNDLVASHTWGDGARLGFTTSLGMNHTYSREQTVTADAEDLVPGTELVRGAVQTTTQNRFETATLGFFGQQQVSFNDQLFLTGAFRLDASSTFGPDERWQMYPKVSGSYVLSSSDWYQSSGVSGFMNELRLRGALGYAGNQPPVGSAYARFPRYGLTVNINRSGLIHLSNPGNPALKPERQREYELGFDAGFVGSRIGVAFTYYDQYVTDLLLTRPFPLSTGYSSVLDNVGELSNRGVELQVDTRNIDRPNLGWNTTLTFSLNRNQVEKLAGAPFGDGYFNWVAEGQPLGVWRLFDYLRDDSGEIVIGDNGFPARTADRVIVGDPNPDFQAALRNEFRLGSRLTANVLLDGVFGHDVWNQTRRIMDRFEVGPFYDRQLRGESHEVEGHTFPITDAYRTSTSFFGVEALYLEDGTFVKLREVSLAYNVPDAFASRLGMGSLTLEVAGRNLLTFTDYTGYDPETNMFGTSTVARGTDFANYPNPRTFSFGLRAGF
jgi:TonB-dependent starch-binding outer membrane protein SusC